MLVGQRHRFLCRFLLGGVVLEALTAGGRLLFSERIHFCLPSLSFLYIAQVVLVAVGGCFAAPLFVSGYFTVVLLWQMLCRLVVGLSSLFERMFCRRCWSVGWMLCHLVCIVDLRWWCSFF